MGISLLDIMADELIDEIKRDKDTGVAEIDKFIEHAKLTDASIEDKKKFLDENADLGVKQEFVEAWDMFKDCPALVPILIEKLEAFKIRFKEREALLKG